MFSKELIDQVVKEFVGSQAAESLTSDKLGKMVSNYLTTKVNRNGSTEWTSYGGSPDKTRLERMVADRVEYLIEKIIREVIEQQEDVLRQAIVTQLKQDDSLANMLADIVLKSSLQNGTVTFTTSNS